MDSAMRAMIFIRRCLSLQWLAVVFGLLSCCSIMIVLPIIVSAAESDTSGVGIGGLPWAFKMVKVIAIGSAFALTSVTLLVIHVVKTWKKESWRALVSWSVAASVILVVPAVVALCTAIHRAEKFRADVQRSRDR